VTATALLERLAARPDRFPGALMLAGPDASLLEIEAMRLAARLLCPGDDPGAACGSCRRALALLHPDLMWISPEGVQIRVDRIREAITFGAGRPYEASRRVAVIVRAELLGPEAANALLKSLEEPGSHLHWILTTSRPEALPSTIISRCAVAPIPARTRAERVAGGRARGLSEEDAEDAATFSIDPSSEEPDLLVQARNRRTMNLAALDASLKSRSLTPLIMLAEELGRADPAHGRLLAELLADAAVAGSGASDVVRHRLVAGATREIGRHFPAEALQRAALLATDAPPDNRRGNRRLHFERVLLDLFRARHSD